MAKFSYILLFFSLISFKKYFVESQSKCSFGMSSEDGIELQGFVFKSFSCGELRNCFSKCMDDSVCQSINYDTQHFHCQFNTDIKRRKPGNVRPKYLGVYMENPKRANRGSHSLLAGHSCKEINDLGESRGDGEYWIDPGNTGQPFTVYCDMTTDSGGWTLIRRAKLTNTNPNQYGRVDTKDYRAISNYSDIKQNLIVPGVRSLREIMGFHQIRYRCYKKSINRVLHIMTTNNTAGHKVLDHFLVNPTWPTACNSFERLPDDTSILAQNCLKWGYYSGNTQVNRWGRYSNTGNWRIYNNAIIWENKHILVFYAGASYNCDDTNGALSIGDIWELYVR